MATRYRNAFFGYSGFVTAAPSAPKAAASKASKKAPARIALVSQTKSAERSPVLTPARDKAAA